jgi:flagellar protein FlbD
MISLHRIGTDHSQFQLNPDLVMTIEANPDTVLTLTTGAKIVVAETPEMVSTKIRNARVDIAAGALQRAREEAKAAQPLRKLDSPVDLSIKRA